MRTSSRPRLRPCTTKAPRADATDWEQTLTLYDLLPRVAPGPIVTLNRIVVLAMVHGAQAGLEMAGDHKAARSHYRVAAGHTLSIPERRYLESRAARLGPARG